MNLFDFIFGFAVGVYACGVVQYLIAVYRWHQVPDWVRKEFEDQT